MEEIELSDLVEGLTEIAPELAEELSRMTPAELLEFFQLEVEPHQEQQRLQPPLLDEPLQAQQGLQPPL